MGRLNGGAGAGGFGAAMGRVQQAVVREARTLPTECGVGRREFLVDVRFENQHWTMLVRIHKSSDGDVFVTRGYTLQNRYRNTEGEFRKALDRFRILKDDK